MYVYSEICPQMFKMAHFLVTMLKVVNPLNKPTESKNQQADQLLQLSASSRASGRQPEVGSFPTLSCSVEEDQFMQSDDEDFF